MNLGDYSPPHLPSPDDQRDALRKGHGRAMRWAIARRLDDGPLLEASLRDLRFDKQVESPRGDWLWRMIREVGATDRFRVPILHALYKLSDGRSAHQLCELARHYAEGGDETFRMQLYEVVEGKPFEDSPCLGESEIIALDGERGFLFAARVRGRLLAGRDWGWDDGWLVSEAIERFGEGRVGELLGNTKDKAIEFYRECWRRQGEMAGRSRYIPHRERMRAITLGDILKSAGSGEGRFGLFRGWGMYAEETDLMSVLRHLLAAREPRVISALLSVFSNRAAPSVDARLVELCRHGDTEVSRRAIIALEMVEHPLVREFALAGLEREMRGRSVVGLFVRNYRRGDEHRILESVEIPDDENQLHWFLMDVIKVLEENPDADCSRLGLVAYASTPCENCRADAARLLVGDRVAPEWLTEECRFDANEACRGLVSDVTGPPLAEAE